MDNQQRQVPGIAPCGVYLGLRMTWEGLRVATVSFQHREEYLFLERSWLHRLDELDLMHRRYRQRTPLTFLHRQRQNQYRAFAERLTQRFPYIRANQSILCNHNPYARAADLPSLNVYLQRYAARTGCRLEYQDPQTKCHRCAEPLSDQYRGFVQICPRCYTVCDLDDNAARNLAGGTLSSVREPSLAPQESIR